MNDQRTFAALKCLVDEQKFALGVNLTSANTPGMPGYRGYENALAMWGTIATVVFVFTGYGWLVGLLSVPFGVVAFMIAGRVVQKRAGSRTRRWALGSASRLVAMWEADVVSIVDAQSGRTAISARGDDLGEFVRKAVNSIFATDRDPVAKKLEAAFAGLVSESQGEHRYQGTDNLT